MNAIPTQTAIALLFLTLLPSLHAQSIIHVDASNGSPSSPYASWTDAATTLQDALAIAGAGDEIRVAGGTYYPDEGGTAVADARTSTFTLIEDVEIYGGFPTGGGATRDPDVNPTILSGDLLQDDDTTGTTDNAYHVVFSNGSTSPITTATVLDGFTITAGNANRDGVLSDRAGSGIYLKSASPTIRDCSIQGNNAATDGGGIYTDSSSATLWDCSIHDNTADRWGGGLYSDRSSLSITNCSVRGNRADNGGGVYDSNGGGANVLTNCSIQGNRATLSNGGGILNKNNTSFLINCSIQGNRAARDGGGVGVSFGSSTSTLLTNCIVWNNRDSSGTGSAKSSISGAGFTYQYSLVQGRHPGGPGNFDGNNPLSDPLFVNPVSPNSAPTTSGDLTLSAASPARDAGDGAAGVSSNATTTDLAGNDRFFGLIDLGAFEVAPDLLVTNANNANSGSLRHAVNNASAGDFIGFDPGLSGQTINLSGNEILVDVDVIIDGSSLPGGVTVDGQQNNRVFKVAAGTTATFEGFTITGGRTDNGTNGSTGSNGTGSPPGPGGQGDAGGDSEPGGGIYNEGTLTLKRVTLRDCATGDGGTGGDGGSGLPPGNGGDGGKAGDGGGIYNSGLLTAVNCTIVDNTTGKGGNGGNGTPPNSGGDGGNGGGICNDGTLILNHNTITGNTAGVFGAGAFLGSAGEGGGIFHQSGIVTLGNTIVAQNFALSGGPDYEGAVFGHPELNFFGDPTGATGIGTLNTDYLTGDPMLAALADNGGPTQTRAPLPGSPVIDPANGDTVFGLPRDQRGAFRLFNAIADLGAVEAFVSHVDLAATAGIGNGTSWSDAYLTLQDALNADLVPHEVWVAQGTYYPDEGTGQSDDARESTFQLINGVSLFGGFPTGGGDGTFAARDSVAYPAILSGNLKQDGLTDTVDNAYHVVAADTSITNATQLDGFTISEGRANGVGTLENSGGGLLLDGASPKVTDCSFTDHIASDGGAVFVGQNSTPVFTRCRFLDNDGTMGGAMFLHIDSVPRIVACSFENNLASSNGGAVRMIATGAVMYIRCDFFNNFAGGGGGAVSAQENTNATFTNCAFKGNYVNNWGGAVFNNNFSTNTFINCLFSGGSADTGGAFYNNDDAVPVYINCTFSGNNARAGGAFYNDNSNPDFTSCIVWNNRSYSTGIGTQDASALNSGTSAPTYDYCLIQAYNPGGTNLDGTNSGNDPLFVTDIDPTMTPTSDGDLRLLTTSPALDAGDHDAYVAATGPATDLAGNNRTIDEVNVVDTGSGAALTYLDLGAYEGSFVTFAHLYPSLNPDDDDNNNNFTNYEDYAAGADPTDGHDPTSTISLDEGTLTFTYRPNAADVHTGFYQSTDLTNWTLLTEGIDFSVGSPSSLSADQTQISINLFNFNPATTRNLFFTRDFSPTP